MNVLEGIEAFKSGLMWIGLSALAAIAVGVVGAWMYRDATSSNGVEVVFGRDADGDGRLSRTEEEMSVGYCCCEWKVDKGKVVVVRLLEQMLGAAFGRAGKTVQLLLREGPLNPRIQRVDLHVRQHNLSLIRKLLILILLLEMQFAPSGNSL